MRSDAPATTVSLVDDHELVGLALRAALHRNPRLRLLGAATTVDGLLAAHPVADVVVLDLRLADASSPLVNVRRLHAAGARVLAFTSGESPYLTRLVLQGDVLGIVRKSEPLDVLVAALQQAADGRPVTSPEWAHALATDPRTVSARLSDREARILTLFADGGNAPEVAAEVGVTVGTLEDYVRRIRAKYVRAGRPARTKVDLYKRAVEDGLLPVPSRA